MASSASKSALKTLAKIAAERLRVIREVRIASHEKFETIVTEFIGANTFTPGECMVDQVAKDAAKKFGLSEDAVTIVTLHNGWVAAQFTHTVETPFPQLKGKAKQPAVMTSTLCQVVKASAKIKIICKPLPTDEKESRLGGEVLLKEFQRPHPPSEGDN